jgi:hypothetical protein
MAVQFATDLVANTPADDNSLADEGVDVDRPLAAAFELLSINVAGTWPMVWRAVEKNGHFAREFFAQPAMDPNSKTALDVVRCVHEHQLADMYIWVARHSAPTRKDHEFGIITPEKALDWLGRVIIDGLARRGTAEASRQVRRIKETLPGEPLEFLTRSTEELVRRNTWRPMSPSDLLDLARSASTLPQGADRPWSTQVNTESLAGQHRTTADKKPRTSGARGSRPSRRNAKYEAIDKTLREIADARPKNHEDVFRLLDEGKVAVPNRKPFRAAGGWLKGFQRDRHAASVWLSQDWGRLMLPPFAPGPKK